MSEEVTFEMETKRLEDLAAKSISPMGLIDEIAMFGNQPISHKELNLLREKCEYCHTLTGEAFLVTYKGVRFVIEVTHRRYRDDIESIASYKQIALSYVRNLYKTGYLTRGRRA